MSSIMINSPIVVTAFSMLGTYRILVKRDHMDAFDAALFSACACIVTHWSTSFFMGRRLAWVGGMLPLAYTYLAD